MPRPKTMHYEPSKTTRWTLIVPAIKKTFFENGVRYYETVDHRKWQADIFDLKLVPPKLAVLKVPRRENQPLKPNR